MDCIFLCSNVSNIIPLPFAVLNEKLVVDRRDLESKLSKALSEKRSLSEDLERIHEEHDARVFQVEAEHNLGMTSCITHTYDAFIDPSNVHHVSSYRRSYRGARAGEEGSTTAKGSTEGCGD